MPATVTAKGQITIPKAVRDALGVDAGSVVEFRRNAQGGIEIVKQGGTPSSRFDRFAGIADAGLTTDQIMALTRGED